MIKYQIYSNVLNYYHHNTVIHKRQNDDDDKEMLRLIMVRSLGTRQNTK